MGLETWASRSRVFPSPGRDCDVVVLEKIVPRREANKLWEDRPDHNRKLYIQTDIIYRTAVDASVRSFTSLRIISTSRISIRVTDGWVAIINSLSPHLRIREKRHIVAECFPYLRSISHCTWVRCQNAFHQEFSLWKWSQEAQANRLALLPWQRKCTPKLNGPEAHPTRGRASRGAKHAYRVEIDRDSFLSSCDNCHRRLWRCYATGWLGKWMLF